MIRSGNLEARLRANPDPATRRSVTAAWLHLVEAGLVTTAPDDLVTVTLTAVLAAAGGNSQ